MRRVGVEALTASAVALALIVGGSALVEAGASGTGSDGVGDPFFAQAGNGGYDVQHYDLTMSWDPGRARLDATAVIDVLATQDLDQLDLDLRGFNVTSVVVAGNAARFSRLGQELVIKPARRVLSRQAFTIKVVYSGTPGPVIDPDGSSEGWMPTSNGIVALGEPQGSPAWFPSNDHPTDKATFELTMTVPNNLVVVSNGLPDPPNRQSQRTTYRWHEDDPMATYLATVSIGNLTMSTTKTRSGLPVISAVTPSLANASAPSIARIPEMVDWLSTLYGVYPFDSIGAIVVDAPDVGYELETQSRPTFTTAPDDSLMVHELAHQWVGNSVSLTSWPEIWLNEGFAGYTEWLWSEHDKGRTADALFHDAYDNTPADDPFWKTPPLGLPDASELFSDVVYTRGAMTLHALRLRVGDAAFFKILRTWTTDNRNGNVTTAQFIALAERVSGLKLNDFFKSWLDTSSKPSL